ncbi:hypothetical protein DOY81_004500 [Sarcophaga bullata]|nr:hypothetical protein DOY81_004500 [Sarcophaga bullata]
MQLVLAGSVHMYSWDVLVIQIRLNEKINSHGKSKRIFDHLAEAKQKKKTEDGL